MGVKACYIYQTRRCTTIGPAILKIITAEYDRFISDGYGGKLRSLLTVPEGGWRKKVQFFHKQMKSTWGADYPSILQVLKTRNPKRDEKYRKHLGTPQAKTPRYRAVDVGGIPRNAVANLVPAGRV